MPLRKIYAQTPFFTNAHLNREAAEKLHCAGFSIPEIVAAFPEVFKMNDKGQLGQRYTGEYVDSGLLETDMLITQEAIQRLITDRQKGSE